MSFPLNASWEGEVVEGSCVEDGFDRLSTATDVLELLRRADAITPTEIDLWAALVVGEEPELFVHSPRPPSAAMMLGLAESMAAELRVHGGDAPELDAVADQARLSCLHLQGEVLTGLSEVYRDHLTQRGQRVTALSRAATTSSRALTPERCRHADEALEVVAWMLGSLARRERLRDSVTDPLSGAYTRAFFEEVLDKELRRHARHAAELAVILLQLRRSSPAQAQELPPPRLLALVADVMMRELRSSDLVARLDARRLIAMMPATNPREGLIGASRLGEMLREGKELEGWSIDIGISGVGLETAGAIELLDQAEQAMRAAERRRADHPFVYV